MPTDEETSSNLRKLRSCQVCVICGRPAEAQQIARTLGLDRPENRLQGHEVEKVKDGHTFYLGKFRLASGEMLGYYITSSLRQGIQSFTINAALLLSILKPRFVIHAGVCAAYDDPNGKLKMQLRDVAFGEAAINYDEGKWETDGDGEPIFRPDYNRVSTEAGDMQAFAESKDRPHYHYGEYISGSAVRGDAGRVFEKIRSSMNRNVIALDMEASAFIQLCAQLNPQGPKCLGIIKGISDFGNSEKGKDVTVYDDALKNTAEALQSWITHQIEKITWEVDESEEPGAKLVLGYYENFARRLLDNHVQGWEARYKDQPDVKIPNATIKGLKSVLPKGRQPSFVKELGQIQMTVAKYGIKEVYLGGKSGERWVFYKDGYFIDWCRTLNSLGAEGEDPEDAVYQVGAFERVLKKQHYYAEEPLATIVEWDDMMAWLDAVVEAESKKEPRDAAVPVSPQRTDVVSRGSSEFEDMDKRKKKPGSPGSTRMRRFQSMKQIFHIFQRHGSPERLAGGC